jgi:hypothetical protein
MALKCSSQMSLPRHQHRLVRQLGRVGNDAPQVALLPVEQIQRLTD